jgi:hypothetical protein
MPKFEKRVQDKVAASVIPMKSAIIMNSYYDPNSGAAYIDAVVIQNGIQEQLTRVPVLKTGGLSTSLPPVGSTAVIGFMDHNDERPFLVGYLDSEMNEPVIEDDRTPRKPPTSLTR